MIICHCFRISDKEIIQLGTLRNVLDNTNATKGCGSCAMAIIEVLNDNPSDSSVLELRQRLAEKAAQKGRGQGPEPRYDDVFFQGTHWLDSLAEEDEQSEPDTESDEAT